MATTSPVERLRDRLDNVRPSGSGFTARCPAHDDRNNSLKVDPGDDGRALIRCFAGCPPERVVAALDLTLADLFAGNGRREGARIPPNTGASAQRSPGCTVAGYAAAKRLPEADLRAFGLTDVFYVDAPAVRIPYRSADGAST